MKEYGETKKSLWKLYNKKRRWGDSDVGKESRGCLRGPTGVDIKCPWWGISLLLRVWT